MRFAKWSLLVCVGMVVSMDAAPIPVKKEEPKPATVQKLRESLKVAVTADLRHKRLHEVLEILQKQTGVTLKLDRQALMPYIGWGMGPDGRGMMMRTPMVKLNAKQMSLGDVLKAILKPTGLTHVLMKDQIMITTNQAAMYRQVQQEVSIGFKDTPLSKALNQLSNETGARFLIDPTVTRVTEPKVTLKIEDVSLDTAVRLIAAVSGTNAVAVGKVIFVTTAERGKVLQAKASLVKRPNTIPQIEVPPGVMDGPPGMGFPGGGPIPVEPGIDPEGPGGIGGGEGGVAPGFPGQGATAPGRPVEIAPPPPVDRDDPAAPVEQPARPEPAPRPDRPDQGREDR